MKNMYERLREALEAACGALEDECQAAGPDDVREHPVLRDHARIAAKGRKVLADLRERKVLTHQ